MGCGWADEIVESGQNAPICVREEVALEVERDPDRRMPHLRLQVLRARSGCHHQFGVGVAEVVEAEAGELRAADGGPKGSSAGGGAHFAARNWRTFRRPLTVAEVVVVEDRALRRGEDEVALVRLPCEQLSLDDPRGGVREVGAAIFALVHGLSEGFQLDRFFAKAAIAVPFAALAGYAISESSRHREQERINRQVELQLASLDAYLVTLPQPEQDRIRAHLAERFFGELREGSGALELPP